jgi:hypothetical protein
MKLPVDTSSLEFLAVSIPVPVIDFESKTPRIGPDGKTIYSVDVVAIGQEGADILSVKLSGEVKGLSLGVPVKLTGLVATTWQMGDRHGVSFRCSRIDILSTKTTATA